MRKIRSKAASFAIVIAAALAATPLLAQSVRVEGPLFSFRFDHDERGDVEGKRASCEIYAQIAQIQADANRKYRCGFGGPRWDPNPEPHFRWCRYVRRETIGYEFRERAMELQRCFDRLGDFDDDRYERR